MWSQSVDKKSFILRSIKFIIREKEECYSTVILNEWTQKRLTHRVHSSISKKSSYSKWTNQVKTVKRDLEEAEISRDLVWNRNEFRDAVKLTNKLKPLTSVTARPNSKWTVERKANQSSRMKIYLQKRKHKEK
uniref:Uncharacterized protein n=1 Tax=Cacopsylla melanoneura TaxID=428564 RepID=A0A8D8VX87_9HEMI